MAVIAHANFRATDPRPSRRNQSVTFGAASSAVAETIAAELQNWTTGQLTSVTAQVGGDGYASSYPVGTRVTAQVIASDSTYGIVRVNIRNVVPQTLLTPGNLISAITALMMGQAYSDTQYTVVALSAPPVAPKSGNPIAVVNKVSFVTKY